VSDSAKALEPPMNADKGISNLGFDSACTVIAEATHPQGFIGVHRRSSAVKSLLGLSQASSAVNWPLQGNGVRIQPSRRFDSACGRLNKYG
jgi:hypothetical protein